MTDGAASLMTHHFGFVASGQWVPERESNFLDGGAHWYNVYETNDGKYISVAPIEHKFYVQLLRLINLDPAELPDQFDKTSWPAMRQKFAEIFAGKTRDEWCAIMEGHEVCFAPVLDLYEAIDHAHARARENFQEVDGVLQPRPAPRFSRTPSSIRRGPPTPGGDTVEALSAWGFSQAQIAELRTHGTVS